jgi:peptidoglycan/xylan/chitin deacetylase (PgdA/CDA1 family)
MRLGRSLAAFVLGCVALAAQVSVQAADSDCKPNQKPIFLTFDTGSQSQAEFIRDVLRKYGVKATFFLANEKTVRDDYSLDSSWASYWRELVADGHAFGTHTFDHVYYRGDVFPGEVKVRPQYGDNADKTLNWNAQDYCAELDRVKTRFNELTGAELDPFWRAPGGKISQRLIEMGKSCGYQHFGWADAGFLGDELPSDKYPNKLLLERALKNIRPGDIVMSHLGIRSRKDPFAPMLDPLIAGLKQKGYCFATLRHYPAPSARASSKR